LKNTQKEGNNLTANVEYSNTNPIMTQRRFNKIIYKGELNPINNLLI